MIDYLSKHHFEYSSETELWCRNLQNHWVYVQGGKDGYVVWVEDSEGLERYKTRPVNEADLESIISDWIYIDYVYSIAAALEEKWKTTYTYTVS